MSSKEWRKTNPDKVKATNAKWYKNNKDKVYAITAKWRKANPDKIKVYAAKWRKFHPDKKKAATTKWAKANPDKCKSIWALRRALRRGATIEKVDRSIIFKRDEGCCHLCGKKVKATVWHLDHLIPLSKGGEHSYRNVAVSHPLCNKRKGPGRLPSQLRLFG